MTNSKFFENFAIDNMLNNNWRKKNVEYLENPTGMRGQNTKYRALSYIIVGNELFKKTPKGILLICLSETEAYLAIYDIHTGACGAH